MSDDLSSDLDHLFVGEGEPMDNDYMDIDSDDAQANKDRVNDFRADWANWIDDNIAKEDLDPTHNPAQSGGPNGFEYERKAQRIAKRERLAKQLRGFNTNPRKGVVARVIVDELSGNLIGSPVVLKANGKFGLANRVHTGRVAAVEETEFAVIWDDGRKFSSANSLLKHLVNGGMTIERKRNFVTVSRPKVPAKRK